MNLITNIFWKKAAWNLLTNIKRILCIKHDNSMLMQYNFQNYAKIVTIYFALAKNFQKYRYSANDPLTIFGHRYDYQRRRAVALGTVLLLFSNLLVPLTRWHQGRSENEPREGAINSHEKLDVSNGSTAETIEPPSRHRFSSRRSCCCRRRRLRRRHRRRGRRCEAHVHVAESPDRSFLFRSKNNL